MLNNFFIAFCDRWSFVQQLSPAKQLNENYNVTGFNGKIQCIMHVRITLKTYIFINFILY